MAGRARTAAWDALAPALRRSLAENGLVLALMASYVVSAAILAAAYDFAFSLTLYAPLWALMAAGLAVYGAVRGRLPQAWRADERLALAGPPVLLAPAFYSAFTSVKSAIGLVHPYRWDGRLGEADRFLLGGEAWRALQPALGHPPVTFVLSLLYGAWHPALILVFGAVAFSLGRPALRRQALTALILCWALLGTAAAIAFSSVGPCFAGRLGLGSGAVFGEQAAYLAWADSRLPLLEFAEQQRLLTAFADGRPTLGSGISAMPSMHVAVALLMALIGWRTARLAGALGTAYLVVVVAASIHLGWHYAWDSIAALAGTALIWAVSGWSAEPRPAPQPAPRPGPPSA